DLGLWLPPPLHPEVERRLERAVEGPRPPAPDGALATDDLDDLVVLEGGERLSDDRVAPGWEAHQGGEVVAEAVDAALAVAEGKDGEGITPALEVPEREVEGVDGLLEDPRAHALAVVAPAAGPRPVREPEQLEEGVERIADLARVDQPLDVTPL